MAFHLAAFLGTITTFGVRQTVPPILDMVLPSTGAGFILPATMKIVAAYATMHSDATSGGLQNARINAPSLLRVSYPYIRPVSQRLGEETNPNVMNLIAAPLVLPASETVGVEVVAGLLGMGAATPSPAVSLLWFCDGLMPVPPGELCVLRFSATGLTTTANAWSPIGPLSFDQNLPAGAYTVVGLEHWSPTAIAARLSFPGMSLRPGTLSVSGQSLFANTFPARNRSERLFFEGGVGVYGTFNSFAPPSLEILTTGSDTVVEVYVTVIRTGEIGFTLPNQEPPYTGPLTTAGVQHEGPLTAIAPESLS